MSLLARGKAKGLNNSVQGNLGIFQALAAFLCNGANCLSNFSTGHTWEQSLDIFLNWARCQGRDVLILTLSAIYIYFFSKQQNFDNIY